MKVAVLRLTNTYGPRMRVKDDRQTFLGSWLRAVITGEPIRVFGDGTQRRDFTYVDDAVRALLLAATRDHAGGRVFNLGGERVIELRELAELLVSINGGGEYRLEPFPPDRKSIDIGDYVADDGAIREGLGWAPTVPLDDGLARTLAYYRDRADLYWDAP
jgi:UDP-glucose 4-epimerase